MTMKFWLVTGLGFLAQTRQVQTKAEAIGTDGATLKLIAVERRLMCIKRDWQENLWAQPVMDIEA